MMYLLQLLFVSILIRGKVASGHTKDFYRNLPPVEYDKANASKTDVIYKLFTSINDNGIILHSGDCNLDKTVTTVLIIHGWTTDDSSPWYAPLKKSYFESGPHNVIYINWNKAGNLSYDISSANIDPMGKFIAEFLIGCKLDFHKVHLVGHSLGSQLAGFIGKHAFQLTGQKIGRITALDPAGPKFQHSNMNPNRRLNKEDAEFVDVIHTDVQWYGFTAPIGHVDFYPNEGKHQPGCPLREIDDNCSHARSTKYFIESFKISTIAKECTVLEQGDDFIVTIKPDGQQVVFGQYVNHTARGSFAFKTNSEPPFLIAK